MIATLFAAAMVAQASPARAVYAYTGLPTFVSNQGAAEVRTHSVTITVKDGSAEGTSTTEVRNPSDKPATVKVRIPLKGYATQSDAPMVNATATWGGRALSLLAGPSRPAANPGPLPSFWSGFVEGTAYMPPRSTSALKVTFRAPLGTAGLDRKLRVVAYDLSGGSEIGQLNATIRYDERQVFGLPKIVPAEGWQIGKQGAFLRIQDFKPQDGAVVATFYSGGF
jgi:hypothetical protein